MPPTEAHCLQTLPFLFLLSSGLAANLFYLRGWTRLRRLGGGRTYTGEVSCFLAGTVTLLVVTSPILMNLDHRWLTGHMVQHLTLTTLVAPLLLLGKPIAMFRHSRAEPRSVRTPHPLVLAWTNPLSCWLAGVLCVLAWHIPGIFEMSMQSVWWHALEELSFLASGLLFWIPVMRSWPTLITAPNWFLPLYLFLATIPCDALSAFLTFCGRVVYPTYASQQPLLAAAALQDQQRAGALMWVWVTFAYLAPAVLLILRMLSLGESVANDRVLKGVAGAQPSRPNP